MSKIIILVIVILLTTINSFANGSQKWKKQVANSSTISEQLRSAPAVSDNGNIYTVSRTGALTCLSSNGSIKWSKSIKAFNESSVSTDHEGNVYLGGSFLDDQMHCFDKNGNLKYIYPTTGEVSSSPAISQDRTAYFGDNAGYFYAIKSDGSLLWKIDLIGSITSSPSIGKDGTIYIVAGYNLTAIQYNGEILWQTNLYNTWNDGGTSTPAIAYDGTIFVAGSNAVYAINPDGSVQWSYKITQAVSSSPAIAPDGTIYIGTWAYDHALLALNPNGSLKWKFDVNSMIYSSPSIDSNGRIYFTSTPPYGTANEDFLYCLNSNGTVYWKKDFTGYGCTPIIGPDGTLYVNNKNGYIYAFETGSSGPANSSWPMSGGMSSRSSNFNFNDQNAPVAAFSSDTINGVAPLTIKFSNKSMGTISNYLWNFGDGNTSTDENPTHTYQEHGYYNVSLITSNFSQKAQTILPKYITVFNYNKPIAMFNYSGSSLANSNFAFTDNCISPDSTLLLWNFGDGEYSTLRNPNHKFKKAGFYTVSLSVSDTRGNDSTSKTLAVFSFNEDKLPTPDHKMAIGFDNKLYIPDYKTLKCINDDGTNNWEIPFNYKVRAPMQANDSTIYFGCEDGNVYAFTTEGEKIAEKKLSYYIKYAPALGNDGSVLVVDTYDYVYSLSPELKVNWKKQFHIGTTYAPVIGRDGTIYMVGTFSSDALVAVNPNGTVKWEYKFKESASSSLALSPDGTIYYASNKGYLHAINEAGEQLWSYKLDNASVENPLIDKNGNIYLIAGRDAYCLNPLGSLIWKHKTRRWLDSYSVIGANDVIFLFGEGYVFCLNKNTGEEYYSTYHNCIAPLSVSYTGKIFGYSQVLETGCMGMANEGWPSVHFDNRNTGNINSVTTNFAASPDSGMAPLTIKFINQTQGNNLHFIWDFGDGTTSTEENPAHLYENTGLYTVSLSASNETTTQTHTKENYIEVAADVIKVGFASADTVGYQPFTVQFENLTTGTVDSWLWDFGDGETSTDKNPKHTYNHYGDYTVSLTASDETETVLLSKENYIHVNLKNDLSAYCKADITSGNYPLTVNFTNNSRGTIEAVFWDFGDSITSTEENPVHTYQLPGVYTVSLTVSNVFYSKTRTYPDLITVIDPEIIYANFMYDEIEGLAPVIVNFHDQSTGNVDVWEWDFGDGTTSNEQNPTHYYAEPGDYTVILKVTNERMSDTTSVNFRLYRGYNWYLEYASGVKKMPVVDENNLIYFADGKTIRKIDIHGMEYWSYEMGSNLYTDILMLKNTIYCLNTNRELLAINTNGELKWKIDLDYKTYLNMAGVSNGMLVLVAEKSFIMAIDSLGKELWRTDNKSVYSSPAINSNNEIIVGNTDDGIYIFDFEGNLKKEMKFETEWAYIDYISLLNDSVAYITTDLGEVRRINLNTGSEWLYKLDDFKYNYANPTIDKNGNIYFTEEKKLISVDENGKLRWFFNLNSYQFCSPSIDTDGNLYITDDEFAYCLNNSGELIWDFYDPYGYVYTPPLILNDGTVLICSSKGLYGINTSSYGYATENWPTQFNNLGSTLSLEKKEFPEARFSASKKKFTIPDTIQFYDASIGNTSSWTWNFGDGMTSTEQNPKHLYRNPGRYSVQLIVGNENLTDTVTYINYILVEPQVLKADFIADTTSGQTPFTVQFTDNSQGAIENWEWNFGDGNFSDKQSPAHTFAIADTFSVSLIINGFGASDTLIKENYIISTKALSNGQVSNPSEIIIYPNPVTSILIIKGLPDNSKTTIEVFTLDGKKVLEELSNTGTAQLKLSHLIKGAYYLRFNKLKTTTVKILKI